jgi:hypothetical protein
MQNVLDFIKSWMAAAALTTAYVLLFSILSGIWAGERMPSLREFLIGVEVWFLGIAIAMLPVAILLRIMRGRVKRLMIFVLAGIVGLVAMAVWAYSLGGELPSLDKNTFILGSGSLLASCAFVYIDTWSLKKK